MNRENFLQKWSTGIKFDPNLKTIVQSLEKTYFLIKKDKKEIINLKINNGIYLVSIDNFFGVKVDLDINDLDEGEYQWEINIFHNEKTVLKDSGIINAIGKPTKEKIARPWDLINPNTKYVDSEISEMRLKICKSCDMFMKGICKSCGCYMPIKTKISHASCPINKWGKTYD
jgi:hypothetical protein